MSRKKTKGSKLKARDLERLLLQEFKRSARKQFNPKQLIRKLKIKNSQDSVASALGKLEKVGKIRATDNYKYQLARDYSAKHSKTYLEGRVDLTRSGSAYIVVEGDGDDIFVPASRLGNAQDGDKVKVRYWTPSRRRKPEGEVVEVVERSVTAFVGTYREFPKYAEVVVEQPGGHQLLVAVHRAQNLGAETNEKVVVRIDDWTPNRFGQISGTITAVLGEEGSSEIEMQSILINNGFDITFPEAVIRESEALPAKISPQEINIRKDMREVTTFTIDPLTAKDFDDALSIRILEDGQLEVGVHIADVSHYVRPGSALDREARARGNSTYFPDRVVPMLPDRLSGDLCSLHEGVERACVAVCLQISADGEKLSHRFERALMRSVA
ncbi:MAG: RNB domain-containing ribonuclease, partial [Bacteroidota bacterium]